MKMTALAFCHLSRDIKKKVFQAFLGSFVSSPYLFDSTVLSPFFFKPICFRPIFYKYYLLLQTDKKCWWQEDNKRKSHKKHGKFPFCCHPIMAGNTSRVHMGSEGIFKLFERRFGLFHVNLSIKRGS